jgi:hypothetical protein
MDEVQNPSNREKYFSMITLHIVHEEGKFRQKRCDLQGHKNTDLCGTGAGKKKFGEDRRSTEEIQLMISAPDWNQA